VKTRLFFSALASLLIGTAILDDLGSTPDAAQTARLLAGAVFVSLGLVTLLFLAKNWLLAHIPKHWKVRRLILRAHAAGLQKTRAGRE
jgi:hypothetical protein